MSVASISSGYLVERKNEMFQRLVVSSATKFQQYLAWILTSLSYTSVQILILFVFGRYVLNVSWFHDPFIILSVLFAYLVAVIGLSMVLLSFSNSKEQFNLISTLTIVLTSMLGGAFFPVELMPQLLQMSSLFTPQGWLMPFLNRALDQSLTPAFYMTGMIVLFGFGMLCMLIDYLKMHVRDDRFL